MHETQFAQLKIQEKALHAADVIGAKNLKQKTIFFWLLSFEQQKFSIKIYHDLIWNSRTDPEIQLNSVASGE